MSGMTNAELHRIAVSAPYGMSEGGTTVEGLRAVAAAAWDEALVHVWALNDPVCTVIADTDSTHPILTSNDVGQARAENPYMSVADERTR